MQDLGHNVLANPPGAVRLQLLKSCLSWSDGETVIGGLTISSPQGLVTKKRYNFRDLIIPLRALKNLWRLQNDCAMHNIPSTKVLHTHIQGQILASPGM